MRIINRWKEAHSLEKTVAIVSIIVTLIGLLLPIGSFFFFQVERIRLESSSNPENFSKEISLFLRERYKEGRVDCVPEENILNCWIDRIRGEVLRDSAYWEKLQLTFFLYENGGHIYINAVVDGWYAAGAKPPRERSGYADMEPRYSSDLSEYFQSRLWPFLKTHLHREAGAVIRLEQERATQGE